MKWKNEEKKVGESYNNYNKKKEYTWTNNIYSII